MRIEEEVQAKADEMADRIEESQGRDEEAMRIREVLDWVLEGRDDI